MWHGVESDEREKGQRSNSAWIMCNLTSCCQHFWYNVCDMELKYFSHIHTILGLSLTSQRNCKIHFVSKKKFRETTAFCLHKILLSSLKYSTYEKCKWSIKINVQNVLYRKKCATNIWKLKFFLFILSSICQTVQNISLWIFSRQKWVIIRKLASSYDYVYVNQREFGIR